MPTRSPRNQKFLGLFWSPATGDLLHLQKNNVWTLPNRFFTKSGACLSVCPLLSELLVPVSKASYGWQCRLPSLAECRTFDTALARACRISPQSEPRLRSLLLGHQSSLYFRSAFDQIMSTWKTINKSRLLPKGGGWVSQVLRKGLCRLGWEPQARQWTWKNAFHNLSLNPRDPNWVNDVDRLGHMLCESWRRYMFTGWLNRDHTDSKACINARFNSEQCRHARKLAWRDRNTFHIMTAATVTFAKRYRLPGHNICPWCKADIGHWNHLIWQCKAHPAPIAKPCRLIEARLGRPRFQNDNVAIDHMCRTRLRILAEPEPD